MIIEIILFFLISVISYYLYIYKINHKFYDERGVKYLPGVPIFGNTFQSIMEKEHCSEDIDKVYKAFPDERYVGLLNGTHRVLLIRDPELIKSITVNNFYSFPDHRLFFNDETDTIIADGLIFNKGQRWQQLRSTISPVFTPAKIRIMMKHMIELSKDVIDDLKDKPKDDVDIGEYMRRYFTDLMGSLAFGVQMNSIKEKDNKFYKISLNIFDFDMYQKLKLFACVQLPALSKVLGLNVFCKDMAAYFRRLTFQTIDYRRKNTVNRPDLIQLLMEAFKDGPESECIAGVLFSFYVAGLFNTSNGVTLCFHELALNSDVQEKLYEEVSQFDKENKTVNLDNINKMIYLDCVINEVLRKWSPAIVLDRVCAKEHELPPAHKGGKPYKVKPGDLIFNSVNSIHLDEKYFPDPHVFKPERFSDENKHLIRPFTFMTFGNGPRTCIGARYAMILMKIIIYHMILNYKILKNHKTADPIIISNQDNVFVRSRTGSWVKLEAR